MNQRTLLATLIALSLAGLVLLAATYRAEPPDPGDATFSLHKSTRTQWKLPREIREVSGLALLSAHELLMHDDEEAIVYRLDLQTGVVERQLQLGDPPLALDLEGIAILDNDLFVVESTGALYQVPGGRFRTGVVEDYLSFDTGLGETCEIEGLSEDQQLSALLLACKSQYERKDEIAVFEYTPGGDSVTLALAVPLPLPDGTDRLHVSGITTFRDGYLLVAAREHLLVEIDAEGTVGSIAELSSKHHRQTEGIVVSGYDLILADEGVEKRARVTRYEGG